MNLKIISGGQTGADQGGLEGAFMAGFETGGFIPRGYKTEDGPMPELGNKFGLVEAPSSDYVYRTQLNAQLSDMTLWFGSSNSSGFFATSKACNMYNKPFYNVTNYSVDDIVKLIKLEDPYVINIAGNRESKARGLQEKVANIVFNVLTKLKKSKTFRCKKLSIKPKRKVIKCKC